MRQMHRLPKERYDIMKDTEQGEASVKPARVRKTPTRASSPVTLDVWNNKKSFFRQGTTWAGIFTIASAVATGGASVLLDPMLLSQIGAGIALLIAEN